MSETLVFSYFQFECDPIQPLIWMFQALFVQLELTLEINLLLQWVIN